MCYNLKTEVFILAEIQKTAATAGAKPASLGSSAHHFSHGATTACLVRSAEGSSPALRAASTVHWVH